MDKNLVITTEEIDTAVTPNSDNLITSGAIATYVTETIEGAVTAAIEGEY